MDENTKKGIEKMKDYGFIKDAEEDGGIVKYGVHEEEIDMEKTAGRPMPKKKADISMPSQEYTADCSEPGADIPWDKKHKQ